MNKFTARLPNGDTIAEWTTDKEGIHTPVPSPITAEMIADAVIKTKEEIANSSFEVTFTGTNGNANLAERQTYPYGTKLHDIYGDALVMLAENSLDLVKARFRTQLVDVELTLRGRS